MKLFACAVALALCFPFGSIAEKPKVGRPMIQAIEKTLEPQLARLWPDDPLSVVGIPEGMYINGYGAVFSTEVNLAPAAAITPFHQTISKEEVERTHHKKLERMARFKAAMEDMLMSSAASLDPVPADEQITLGVSFFYWYWEDTTGLPAQVVMHAPKKALVMVKSGLADRSTLASALSVQEF